MIRANIKKEYKCNIDRIWNIITNNKNYDWRSDLSKIEIVDENHFIEYAKNGYPTYFTIISKKKYQYKLEFENTNLKGKWTGLFKILPNKNVELDFTEEIETNKIIMKILAKGYLKKQQKRYMQDLEKEINN